MKLAKKMLACAIALAMVAALALTAFAADTKLSVSSAKSEDGKQVFVTVSGKGLAGLQSGKLTLDYNPEVLELCIVTDNEGKESADTTNTAAGAIVIGGIPVGMTKDDGVCQIGVMYATGATEDETDLFTVKFNVLKDENSSVKVSVGEWVGTASVPGAASCKVVLEAATTEAPVTTTEAPVTTTESAEDVSAPETTTKTPTTTPGMGDVGVAAVAGVMALAAVAFVVTRKKDAE